MELEDLIETIDIVEYISQYIELVERNGEWWGLSPFKDERTPSFSIRKENHSFYDFSSGIAGNVFTFTKHYFKCSSAEAIEKLRQFAGADGKTVPLNKKLSATLVCKKYMHRKTVKNDLNKTSLPDDCMIKFDKNYDKLTIWENEGISRETLDKFQVYYDSFSDRLVYPIRDISGKIVNIGGRTIDPKWKEKNLRKYTYFYQWGILNTIYGIAENIKSIQEKRMVILFEGCKSVLIADTWGIHNTGAILTSHLNPQQVKILAKLGCEVVFALDKDVKIKEDHGIAKLKNYVNVSFIFDSSNLLDEKDSPVDKGIDVFEQLFQQRLIYR